MSSNEISKIVVTGAGGFLGGRLLKYLKEVYPEALIIGTSRRSDRKEEFVHAGCDFIPGDLTDPGFCNALTKEVTVVVHCAALSSPWGKPALFEEANVKSTENLLNTSVQNKVQRFIFISTPSIYFDYTDRFDVKESDPLPSKMVNQYALTKLKAEEMVLAYNGKAIETLALRPRAIIGAEDTVIFPRLIRAYQERRLKVIGNGKNIADLTCVRNVLEAVVCSIRSEGKALGQAYNITNGEPIVLWDKINLLLKALSFSPIRKNIPASIVLLVASLMEWKAKMFHPEKEPTLTKYGVGVLAYSLTMDISKAKDLLGYMPVQSTEEGLNEFVKWYKTQPK